MSVQSDALLLKGAVLFIVWEQALRQLWISIPEHSIMSSRALRRLKGKQRGQEDLCIGDLNLKRDEQKSEDLEEEEEEEAQHEPTAKNNKRKSNKSKSQKNISNIFELVRYNNEV